MTEKPQCEAITHGRQTLDGYEYRCSRNARPGSPFCGGHAWMIDAGVVHVEWDGDSDGAATTAAHATV